MKRHSFCTLLVFVISILYSQTAIPPSFGDGTRENPYQIESLENLFWITSNTITWDKFFIQTDDIDANETSSWYPNDSGGFFGWVPIGNDTLGFGGRYDGNRKNITGLYINRPEDDNVGFFSLSYGDVMNINITDADVTGNNKVGIIAGRISGSIILSSSATGSLKGNDYAGGLAGRIDYKANISNCFADVRVVANDYAGGLIGYNYKGIITNSYSKGELSRVSGDKLNFGGFAGYNYRGKILNCYSTGSVTYNDAENPTDKGFCGGVDTGEDYEMYGNFWDMDTSYQTSTYGEAVGKNTAEMYSKSTYTDAGWDFKLTWTINESFEYPKIHWESGIGTKENPYLINNLSELQEVNLNTSAYYALNSDIDASGTKSWSHSKFRGFVPIGSEDNLFMGEFDGQNYTIQGLYIDAFENDYVGLFGYIGRTGSVRKLSLVNMNLAGNIRVGGVAGCSSGSVSECSTDGIITGYQAVGGIVGLNNGEINYSPSSCSVSGSYHSIGGAIGYNMYGLVKNSFATGNITGGDLIGGFVGYAFSYSPEIPSIINCFATGSVQGKSSVGGFIGGDNCSIKGCYATGSVTATGTGSRFAGGLAGYIESAENCYSTGNVYGPNTTHVGGLAGKVGSVINCYSEGNVTGGIPSGGLVGEGYITNSHYNVDIVLINGGKYLTRGGLFGGMYEKWFANGLSLDISEYPSTLVSDGDYYRIDDLQGVRDVIGFSNNNLYKFKLGHDIDFTETPGLYIPLLNTEFDGNGKKVTGLFVDIPFTDNLGFFGEVLGNGSVKDLSIAGNTIKGNSYVGGLAGESEGNIINSYASCKVYGYEYIGGLVGKKNSGDIINSNTDDYTYGDSYVGGLVGYNSYEKIDQSYSTGPTSGKSNVGGIAGYNRGSVSYCYSKSKINSDLPIGTGGYMGGLVGYNNGYITNCSASGTVSGSGNLGGLVGENYWEGYITKSYALGDVSGTWNNVGGLVGYNYYERAKVEYSYSTGKVSGRYYVGGLLGQNYKGLVSNSYSTGSVTRKSTADNFSQAGFVGYNNDGKVINCYSIGKIEYEDFPIRYDKGFCGELISGYSYQMQGNFWDIESSLQTSTYGSAEGKTTLEMKTESTFTDSGWDFNSIWLMDSEGLNNGYPILRASGTGIHEEYEDVLTIINFKLHQNYPNPFNPATTIRYSLPAEADVMLTVFDISGREVAGLVFGRQDKGSYSVNFNADDLTSGMYIYSLKVDGKAVQSRKMMLLK
jgi:hypothetical protein